MMAPRDRSQRGAALLTVLMIIAAMSVAALAVAQAVTMATQRARALDAQAQLALYAVSAEEVAKARLMSILEPLQSRLNADLPGFGEPQTIPVDGGIFTVTVRDATNCFDVNQLAKGGQGSAVQADPTAQADYLMLLESVLESGFSADIVSLVSSLTDWMDDNSVPGNGGAEDAYYLSETPSYRTSAQKLATLDELRAIRGYTPSVIAAIRPLLCALPSQAQRGTPALNINTLEEVHAPLLQLAFEGAIELNEARELILSRPQGGWGSAQDLIEDPIVTRIDPQKIKIERLGLVTSLVEVSANVSYRGHDMTMRYLFKAEPGLPISTLRRERIG
ncbi:MAG: type II secretion system minor pseudopilin GspK [Hyphomonadaceae bacterium]|nr:type II secretion system minor pseudopilin GspK [Hyphomonadaceae bacterium]